MYLLTGFDIFDVRYYDKAGKVATRHFLIRKSDALESRTC